MNAKLEINMITKTTQRVVIPAFPTFSKIGWFGMTVGIGATDGEEEVVGTSKLEVALGLEGLDDLCRVDHVGKLAV